MADPPQPPSPPDVARKFAPLPYQLVGVGVLFTIVLLALFGVFGVVRAHAAADAGSLHVEVEYPERFRYKTIGPVDVRVHNGGETTLDTVVVRFDRAYVDAFSTVTFTPSADTVTDEAYEVTLRDVRPGTTRLVSAEIQAESYWRHEGFVEAVAGGATARAELATLVFP